MTKNLEFRCALVTGGGGGIGRALSEWLVSLGIKVLIAGRTESNLQQTSKEIGAAGYYVLDTGKISAIPDFIQKITQEHPDLDCLINNAGVQRPLDVNKMKADEFLEKADNEIDINIRGPLHLALGLLPHLRTKPNAVIVNVGSILGFVPFVPGNPVYNATKAFMHFWTMALRTQLEKDSGHVKVIEIAPPTVGTALHREKDNPDDNKKENNKSALTVEEFMDEVAEQWKGGKTMITAGPGNGIVGRWYKEFEQDYEKGAKSH